MEAIWKVLLIFVWLGSVIATVYHVCAITIYQKRFTLVKFGDGKYSVRRGIWRYYKYLHYNPPFGWYGWFEKVGNCARFNSEADAVTALKAYKDILAEDEVLRKLKYEHTRKTTI